MLVCRHGINNYWVNANPAFVKVIVNFNVNLTQFVFTDREIDMTFPTLPNVKLYSNTDMYRNMYILYCIHNQQKHLHICTH